jgi:type I restriction enzyme R subunit
MTLKLIKKKWKLYYLLISLEDKKDPPHPKYREYFVLDLLCKLGFEYIYAPDITLFPCDGSAAEDPGDLYTHSSFEKVLWVNRLQNAVRRINHAIPDDAQAEVIKKV